MLQGPIRTRGGTGKYTFSGKIDLTDCSIGATEMYHWQPKCGMCFM